mmetsp:Transcript_15846/g.47054  ORF Transcript_15846/g.47054 Transcript_15846/m.47054 type:complete len:275 (+) Transcript_15846:517-1341(+)
MHVPDLHLQNVPVHGAQGPRGGRRFDHVEPVEAHAQRPPVGPAHQRLAAPVVLDAFEERQGRARGRQGVADAHRPRDAQAVVARAHVVVQHLDDHLLRKVVDHEVLVLLGGRPHRRRRPPDDRGRCAPRGEARPDVRVALPLREEADVGAGQAARAQRRHPQHADRLPHARLPDLLGVLLNKRHHHAVGHDQLTLDDGVERVAHGALEHRELRHSADAGELVLHAGRIHEVYVQRAHHRQRAHQGRELHDDAPCDLELGDAEGQHADRDGDVAA